MIIRKKEIATHGDEIYLSRNIKSKADNKMAQKYENMNIYEHLRLFLINFINCGVFYLLNIIFN